MTFWQIIAATAGGGLLRALYAEFAKWKRQRLERPSDVRNGAVINDRSLWWAEAAAWLIVLVPIVGVIILAFADRIF